MYRSGSTWSYNVVKQLLRRASGTVRGGYTNAIGQALTTYGEKDDHIVVKSHAPDGLGRALIKQRLCRAVYTYREPVDGILSAMEAFKNQLDPMLDIVKASLELMRFQVETGGVLFIWYGDITGSPQDVVQRIADYLGIALASEDIADIATMLSRDNVRRIIKALGKSAPQISGKGVEWDESTLFNNHHVRENPSDPAQIFSAEQIARIADRLSDYVGADAALRPEIRDFGRWHDGATDRPWPSPAVAEPPEPAAEAIDAPTAAQDVPPAPPAAAADATAPDAPLAADAVAPLAAEAAAPDAPLAADSDTPDAPLAVEADAVAPEAPLAADADPATASEKPVEPAATAKPPTVGSTAAASPKIAATPPASGFDPIRDAARRALARDLLGTLRPQPTGKPIGKLGSPGPRR
jgi:hypothetical protein